MSPQDVLEVILSGLKEMEKSNILDKSTVCNRNMFLIFNHTLTKSQEEDARGSWGIHCFAYLPDNLQQIWSQVDPQGDINTSGLEEITRWVSDNVKTDDLVLVQGEFGATFYLVDFCLQNGLIPVYATTLRVAEETVTEDGRIENKHIFKHVNFRKYRRHV